jgi:bifunctional UDP-N-acetylglucosamine pyrophosphorylase/glucosamine-1-phosphate N-acetyltransferase
MAKLFGFILSRNLILWTNFRMTKSKNNLNIGVLLAAGRGERLRPITDTTPKPLVKVFQATLLEQNLKALSPFCDSFVIVVGWLGEKIIEQIGSEFEGKKVTYAWQKNPKAGTLDALRTACLEIDKNHSNYNCIVANSDELRGSKFYQKLSIHLQKQPNKTALAVKKETNKDKLSQFGVVLKNENGEFGQIIEKPETFVSDLINIGLYYFPAKILAQIPKNKISETKEEYILDLLTLASSDGVFLLESDDSYLTITSPGDLAKAELI